MSSIIVYMGGCCGDLVTGLIDSRGTSISNGKCILLKERSKFKRSFEFSDDHERNVYLNDVVKYWNSIPSHDAEYHIRHKQKFTGIVCTDIETATWAASRFKNLHREEVWQRMNQFTGTTTVEAYAQMIIDFSNMIKPHAYNTIELKDIAQGNVLEKLKCFSDIDTTADIFYNQWLSDVIGDSI